MQYLKQISAVVLGMMFLISSSGFIMYKSFCSCTGNEQLSVFVQNEICTAHENSSCCEELLASCCTIVETEQCESHAKDCDCDKPEISYIKLKHEVLKEEAKFFNIEPLQLFVLYATSQFNLFECEESIDFDTAYIDPPPAHNSSQEFLISIQQLKIPFIA